jgi:hypothetical protein
MKNISYSLIEREVDNKDFFTYDELLTEIMNKEVKNEMGNDFDSYLPLFIHFQENFLKKDLEKIADYYNISKRKKKKDELIEDIVIFELAKENTEIVNRRKILWFYIDEIKNDNYLSKFLIFD